MSEAPEKQLVVLVADKNMESAVRGLLARPESLNVRPILGQVDVFVHPNRDPGVFNKAHEFLASFTRQYRFALVMFDREGCGRNEPANELARIVQGRLQERGWSNRAEVVVLDPELEIWVWTDSPHVLTELRIRATDLVEIVAECGGRDPATNKPRRPKEVMEKALRQSGRPRSSAIYAVLAHRVSLHHCQDAAFQHFRYTLQQWFPRV
jgi:hypothetical protein